MKRKFNSLVANKKVETQFNNKKKLLLMIKENAKERSLMQRKKSH